MTIANATEFSFLEKLRQYLETYPGRCCDVSFVVGSGDEKEVIQSSRIILEIVCPEFIKLFDDTFSQAVDILEKEETGTPCNGTILLPNVHPQAFKIFLKLLVFEDVSATSLKESKIPSQDLLNVIELCREYKMTKIQENLEIIAQETLYGEFLSFANSDAFLNLSKNNLNTILLSDRLNASESEILDATIRWVEQRCSEQGVESTGENIRNILGDSLFRIRFLTMSITEFASHIPLRGILTQEEQLQILRYFGRNEETFNNPEIGRASDKVPRSRHPKVQFLNKFEISSDSDFVCDGEENYIKLEVNQDILVQSVGFLGPVDSDAVYEVTVEIQDKDAISCGKCEKQILAKKNEIFHVSFDEPIKINSNANYGYAQDGRSRSDEFYFICFYLKGPNTQIPKIPSESKETNIKTVDGISFNYQLKPLPLAEIYFNKC